MIRLATFEGAWTVTRRIEDRRAGQAGRFEGTAVFAPDGVGLSYTERGHLTFGSAAPMVAQRRYLWREEGERIAVLFDDGRPFHDFAPGTDQQARHLCGPDLYDVTYDFSAWPVWTARWDVAGPAKAYTMISHCAR